jgi:hypothetical protein
LSDGHTQQIIHEFHDTAHRGVTNHRQRQRCLLQPSFSDRQREQHLVLVVGLRRRKEVIQRRAGLVHLPVDQRTTHAVPGDQGADRFSARQSPNGHHLAFVGSQLYGGSATGQIHGEVTTQMGPYLSRTILRSLVCVAQL